MLFSAYCRVIQEIAETRSNNEKIDLFANYLRQLSADTDIELSAQFVGEGAFSSISGRRAAIGHKTIAVCAATFCEIDYEMVFRPSRIATGSASEAIEKLMENLETAIQKRVEVELSLSQTAGIFENLAKARKKEEKESGLMSAWTKLSPLEVKYFLRILGGGTLRIGFETKSILLAIARAFDCDPELVRYTHMITGSIGKTAVLAKNNLLENARFKLFNPIAFMLAAPLESRSIEDFADYIAEEKFDGMRCQLHVSGSEVRLYSRDLNEISDAFPEVTSAFREKQLPSTVLDGEICVFFDNTIQPFQMLQKRMGVKKPSQTLLRDFPVTFIAYDVMFSGGNPLFEIPLWERRSILEEICEKNNLRIVHQYPVSGEADVYRLFDAAIAHGNEGLILKKKDSPYEFGQRRKSWLKVKMPGGSLDTVILYATAGSGKRGGTYSDFTLGVRVDTDDRYDQDFVPIGKAYGGYSNEELKKLNTAIKPLVREKFGPTLSLEPAIVVEIEFDEIQVNKRTKAGYTLRFPRFRAIRWDKGPADTDTLAEVERLYHEKNSRPRVPQHENPSFS